MAGGPSVYQANRNLNKALKGTDYTPPGTYYVALCTINDEVQLRANNIAGASEVASGVGYARQSIAPAGFTTSTTGQIANVSDISFPTATGSWGNCQYGAIMDSATLGSGNVLYFGPLSTPANIQSGDTFKIPAGTLLINQ